MKLGKRPPTKDKRDLKFSMFRQAKKLPVPPKQFGHEALIGQWDILGNDEVGDCVFAGACHEHMLWCSTAGQTDVRFTTANALKAYSDVTGYNPAKPDSDQGTDVRDALKYRRDIGITDAKGKLHRIGAFVALEPGNIDHLYQALYLFGTVGIGIEFPSNAMGQFDKGQPWSPLKGSSIEGGHYIPLVARRKNLQCVTWGKLQQMTGAFYKKYCVTPETLVLRSDLRWIPAGDTKPGDDLFAFDEFASRPGAHRQWRKATVSSNESDQRECLEIELEDGTILRSTLDHGWLTKKAGHGVNWVLASNLRCTEKLQSRILKPIQIWKDNLSREAGYLAGAFDGEGCLTQRDLSKDSHLGGLGLFHTSLNFAQKPNQMRNEVAATLRKLNFHFTEREAGHGVNVLTIGKRRDVLRFMGEIRPSRLMAKFDPSYMGAMMGDGVKVVDIRNIGKRDISMISTSTGTFLANGCASHNCDEAWIILSEDLTEGDGKTLEGFDLPALQDALKSL